MTMLTIVGGTYHEICIEPHWDDVFGSGGRAAAALSALHSDLSLVTYRSTELRSGLENLEAAYGLKIAGPEVPGSVRFEYVHSLGTPRISPRPDAIPDEEPVVVEDDIVLRFGMLEGDARVHGKRVIYDPQSAFDPKGFHTNGSTADHLALILNRFEAERLVGAGEPEELAAKILRDNRIEVVIIKMGGRGALVASDSKYTAIVPPYRSENIWKIGSGDVFSATFAHYWGVEQLEPLEAADLASRATSYYCNTKALPIPSKDELSKLDAKPVNVGSGRIYLAAPFFNLGERWVVEEVRNQLIAMGVDVFSPLHDVGVGPGEVVAVEDLKGLDTCEVVLAILNGGDAGTIFEIGYAVAQKKPVIALAQNVKPEDLKMPIGSGCLIFTDLVTAIYQAVWALA